MIRKAKICDIKEIYNLLKVFSEKGELLPRPLSSLYDHLRDFFVYEKDNTIIGCCALQFCWENLAEIRSLAVNPIFLKKGFGAKLVSTALLESKFFNIEKVFVLTYQVEFFMRLNFKKIDKSQLPLKIWGDCISCVKFPDCDETAMMIEIIN